MQELHEWFRYDPIQGTLWWKKSPGGRADTSLPVGSPNKGGYLTVMFRKKTYLVHRICYLLYHGEWPEPTCDHWDGDKKNNRISNLRPSTMGEQAINRWFNRHLRDERMELLKRLRR